MLTLADYTEYDEGADDNLGRCVSAARMPPSRPSKTDAYVHDRHCGTHELVSDRSCGAVTANLTVYFTRGHDSVGPSPKGCIKWKNHMQ